MQAYETKTVLTEEAKARLAAPASFIEDLFSRQFKKMGYTPGCWGGRQTLPAMQGHPVRGEQGILASETLCKSLKLVQVHALGYITVEYDENLKISDIYLKGVDKKRVELPFVTQEVKDFLDDNIWKDHDNTSTDSIGHTLSQDLLAKYKIQTMGREACIAHYQKHGLTSWWQVYLVRQLFNFTYDQLWARWLQLDGGRSSGMSIEGLNQLFHMLIAENSTPAQAAN